MPAVVTSKYISATAGTGKTISVVEDIISRWLLDSTGVSWSNIPWKYDDWEEFEQVQDKTNPAVWTQGKSLGVRPGLLTVAHEMTGIDRDLIRARIQRIPKHVTDVWVTGKSGPWEFFKDHDLSACRITIDEIHNFCPALGSKKAERAADWQKWLGELRHRGAYVEFLTQSPHKVNPVIKHESEIRISLVSSETRPDFYFGIPMYDWYQLRAKLTGKYQMKVWTILRRMVDGKEEKEREVPSKINSKYFTVYDSFSKPEAGGKSGRTEIRQWERYSWKKLIFWFLANNLPHLIFGRRGGLIVPVLLIWLSVFGGFRDNFPKVFAYANETLAASQPAMKDSSAKQAATGGKLQSVLKKRLEKSPAPAKGEPVGQESKAGAGEKTEPQEKPPDEEWRLGCLLPGKIVFCGGREFVVGAVIPDGPYKGWKIDEISLSERCAVISGERVGLGDFLPAPFLLGRLSSGPVALGESYQATVQRALSGSPGGDGSQLRAVPSGEARDSFGSGHAVSTVPSATQP